MPFSAISISSPSISFFERNSSISFLHCIFVSTSVDGNKQNHYTKYIHRLPWARNKKKGEEGVGPTPFCVIKSLKKRLGLIRSVKEGISGQPGWGPRRRLGQKVSASWLLVSLGLYTRVAGQGHFGHSRHILRFFFWGALGKKLAVVGYEAAGSDGR